MENKLTEILGFGFYYFLFFSILLIVLCYRLKLILRRELIYAIVLLLIVVSAFRATDIDKDYTTYLNSFSLVRGPFDYFVNYSQWNYLEPFYYLIPSILKVLNIQPFDFFSIFIFSTIGICFKIFGISKLSKNFGLSILAYFSFYFFLHEMTQMRAGIASGGLLICAYCFYEKKVLPFIFCLLISMCFQYTGILILLILVLNTKKFNATINIFLLLLSYAVILFKINVIGGFIFQFNLPFTDKLLLTLKTLTQKENNLNPFNVVYLFSLLMHIWLFANYKRISNETPYAILLLKIQLIGFICFGIFSNIAVVAFRLYEFFSVVSIITSTYFVYTIKNKIVSSSILAIYNLFLLINLLHITKLINSYSFIFFND